MSSNDDSRRDRERERQIAEDNPFIAFRRFADSQVSSLLNTVITLPATIAAFNNAHIAREQCLFGRADKKQCDRLAELEAQVASLRSEGRELYRVGDLQAMVKKGEQLMHVDHQAEEVRRGIVEAARSAHGGALQASPFDGRRPVDTDRQHQLSRPESYNDWRKTQSELMERVANEKGQQWGWMWDWGFPRPFDAEDDNIWPDSTARGTNRNSAQASYSATPDLPPTPQHIHAVRTHVQGILDDAGNVIAREVPRIFSSPWYSPFALEEDEAMKRAGVNWRDAFEDLVRQSNGAPLMPSEALGRQQQRSYDEWARRFHDPETARKEFATWITQSENYKPPSSSSPPQSQSSSSAMTAAPTTEEPSYEYSHDHEDQPDDDQDTPRTELDAYERLLGRAHHPHTRHHTSTDSSSGHQQPNTSTSSILSTLTTTERTVAPDGTVTTKVVLKKRFADGREESTETVHKQHADNDNREENDWAADRWGSETARPASSAAEGKKGGWFWSS